MQPEDFRRPFPFINTCLFSPQHIPFQLSNTEKICYINPNTRFALIIGSGAPALTTRFLSDNGELFLTNKRLIYRPKKITKHFESFAISLKKILAIDKDNSVLIQVTSEFVSEIFLMFQDSHSRIFRKKILELIGERMDDDGFMDVGRNEEDVLPLYCVVNKGEEEVYFDEVDE